jgi:hypothetical protein
MSDLKKAAQQALEALENCTSEHGHRCNRCDSEVDEGGRVITALRAALAQQEEGRMEFNVKETVCATCGSTNGAHSHDCPVAKAALAQQEQATVKESLPVGQEEPEGGWQSAPSPQVTQRIADMPMSEYRRGVNDGFKMGLREGRIKAEDEMREQPEQEPVAWGWRYDSCGHAVVNRLAVTETPEPTVFLTNVFARGPFPLYTHPPRREWVSLTEEEIYAIGKRLNIMTGINLTGYARKVARAVEQALKERNT